MRLWTLHRRYLDSQGLVALWREGLLAQAVQRGYSFDRSKLGPVRRVARMRGTVEAWER